MLARPSPTPPAPPPPSSSSPTPPRLPHEPPPPPPSPPPVCRLPTTHTQSTGACASRCRHTSQKRARSRCLWTATALDVCAPRMSIHHPPLPAGRDRPSPPGGAVVDYPSCCANLPGNQPTSYPGQAPARNGLAVRRVRASSGGRLGKPLRWITDGRLESHSGVAALVPGPPVRLARRAWLSGACASARCRLLIGACAGRLRLLPGPATVPAVAPRWGRTIPERLAHTNSGPRYHKRGQPERLLNHQQRSGHHSVPTAGSHPSATLNQPHTLRL